MHPAASSIRILPTRRYQAFIPSCQEPSTPMHYLFFFKYPAPPQLLPSSPPRPFPVLAAALFSSPPPLSRAAGARGAPRGGGDVPPRVACGSAVGGCLVVVR